MWTCSGCKEAVEATLAVCWNCGTSGEGVHDPNFRRADETTPADTAHGSPLDPASLKASTPTEPQKTSFGLTTLLGTMGVCALVFAAASWDLQPKTSSDYLRSGSAHLESGRYASAIANLCRALEYAEREESASNRPAIHARRALAHYHRGAYAAAERDISEALRLTSPWSADGVYAVYVSPETLAEWRLLRARISQGLESDGMARSDHRVGMRSDE